MDPVEAIAGEPRDKGAAASGPPTAGLRRWGDLAPAPDAAIWLNHPTRHQHTLEPATAEDWPAFLLKAGRAMAREDAARWGEEQDDE